MSNVIAILLLNYTSTFYISKCFKNILFNYLNLNLSIRVYSYNIFNIGDNCISNK